VGPDWYAIGSNPGDHLGEILLPCSPFAIALYELIQHRQVALMLFCHVDPSRTHKTMVRNAELTVQMKSLIGNGQPGIVQKMEGRIESREKQQSVWHGKSAVIGTILAAIISLAVAAHDHWIPNLFHLTSTAVSVK
jgi:hypothetical protein